MNDTLFKNVLVALDLSAMDETLIRYVSMLREALSTEKIYFLHISEDLAWPDDILKKYPDLLSPKDETIAREIESMVKKYFPGDGIDLVIDVQEGNAFEKILRYSLVKDIDLIFMGKKKENKGYGIVANKIARKSPCSLLLVPEENGHPDGPVLAAIDFGVRSMQLIFLAQKIATRHKGCSGYEYLHVFSVPGGYSKIGKTREEFSGIMLQNATLEWRRLLKQNGISEEIPCEMIDKKETDPEKLLINYALDKKAALIIIGSKGRTNSASILLGSFAEKLSLLNLKTPLLIVKSKGENMTFLQALLEL